MPGKQNGKGEMRGVLGNGVVWAWGGWCGPVLGQRWQREDKWPEGNPAGRNQCLRTTGRLCLGPSETLGFTTTAPRGCHRAIPEHIGRFQLNGQIMSYLLTPSYSQVRSDNVNLGTRSWEVQVWQMSQIRSSFSLDLETPVGK